MSGCAEIKHFSAAVRILYSWAKDRRLCIVILYIMSWNTTNLIQCLDKSLLQILFHQNCTLTSDIVQLIMAWVLLSDAYIIVISTVVFNYSTKM